MHGSLAVGEHGDGRAQVLNANRDRAIGERVQQRKALGVRGEAYVERASGTRRAARVKRPVELVAPRALRAQASTAAPARLPLTTGRKRVGRQARAQGGGDRRLRVRVTGRADAASTRARST